MKVSSLILGVIFCGLATGQNEPLMRGHASLPNVEVKFETRLEPATPPLAEKLVGGTVMDLRGIHRYLADEALQKSFGYDLQVERLPLGYDYRVTFRPLSLDSAKIGQIVPLPGYPAPQTVHAGAKIALDLFTNAATGQKLVDYIQIWESVEKLPVSGSGLRSAKAYLIRPGDLLYVNVLHQPFFTATVMVQPDGFISMRSLGLIKAAGLTVPQLSATLAMRLKNHLQSPQVNIQILKVNQKNAPDTPRDFSLEDVELRITAPRVSVNGKPLAITSGYKGSVAGHAVWFYLPERGRYTLSLVAHRDEGFIKAGQVRGGTISFTMDGETVELLSNADVAAGSIPFNLYVRYEPAWQPNDVAARGSFLLGSDDEDSVRPEVVRVSDTIGSKKCYISGLVVRPGAYPLTAPKTVYEALAEAGGLTDFAKASKIYVLRGQEKIPFNYNEVKKGRGLQQNIRLQNGDVVVVP